MSTVKRNHVVASCAQGPATNWIRVGRQRRRVSKRQDGGTILRYTSSRAIPTEKEELRKRALLEFENRRSREEVAKIREVEGGEAYPVEVVRFCVAPRSTVAQVNGSICKSVLPEQ